MKVLFVDHVFHAKTLSTRFLSSLLVTFADVTTLFFDPLDLDSSISGLLSELESNRYDLVVVFQLDVLGLFALRRGIPTVLVPMFDSSAYLPALHWRLMSGARLVNLSLTLHLETTQLGMRSWHNRYFLDPARFKAAEDFSSLRGFFWQRRPDQINIHRVKRWIGKELDSLHLHCPADIAGFENSRWWWSSNASVSGWFADKEAFEATLDRANVMICPRIHEGIGMLMLEGMARGMCVIAPRRPVHTEYIVDGVTGRLVDPERDEAIEVGDAKALGARARAAAARGHERWISSIPSLTEFMVGAPRPAGNAAAPDSAAARIVRGYFRGPGYRRVLEQSWSEMRSSGIPALTRLAYFARGTVRRTPLRRFL